MPCQGYTAEFLVGYICSKMEQLRSILHRMDECDNLTLSELEHICNEVQGVDADVQIQAKLVKDDDLIKSKMIEYKKLVTRAELLRRERVQKLEASQEKRKAAMPSDGVNMATKADAVVPREINAEELEIYISDNDEPMPMPSTIRPSRTFRPVEFGRPTQGESDDQPIASTSRQADLRDQLARGRAHRRGGVQIREPSRTGQRNKDDERSRSSLGRGRVTLSKVPSASYVSSAQERFSTAVRGRTYPPFARAPLVPLVRKDPSLIGRSEVFIHPPTRASICPLCPNGKHRMYRCTTMLRAGLQERWYRTLKAGVCLNCMIHGHSHFACSNDGACFRCGCRHNSILCPKNPRKRN